jgi:hypothetical protein
VGFKPTTRRALYQLSYQDNSAGGGSNLEFSEREIFRERETRETMGNKGDRGHMGDKGDMV